MILNMNLTGSKIKVHKNREEKILKVKIGKPTNSRGILNVGGLS